MRHILCFGNPLHGDDGFGPEVYRRLAALPCPADLRLFDAGTPGLSALSLFQDCDEVVIVDTSAPRGQPGRLSQPPFDIIAAETVPVGHGIGVGYLLRALSALPEPLPRIRIVAAEAADITPFRPGLSPALNSAVDAACALLRDYFR